MDIPKPPEELRNIIDKLAQFVARNGPQFEQMTKEKQAGNPRFNFLFGGEFYSYYQYKVASEQAMLKGQEFQKQMPPSPAVALHGKPFYSPPVTNQSLVASQQPSPQSNPPPFTPFNMASFPDSEPPFMKNNQYPSSSIPPPQPFSSTLPHTSSLNHAWRPSFPPPPLPVIQNEKPNIDSIQSQITEMEKQISISKDNLDAQKQVLLEEEKQKRLNELFTKMQNDELKRMCEDYNINLNEFDKILQPIIDSCRKESIANGKIWIFNNCYIMEHFEAVAKHLLKRVTIVDSTFEAKLHLMYLINDLFNHCMRKGDEKLKDAISDIIVPAFSTTVLEADDDKKQKMNKLLKLWEMNQYLDQTLLDQLKSPQESLDAYKTSLNNRYSEQIEKISAEQSAKFAAMIKQHEEFVHHCQVKIEDLQKRKASLQHPASLHRPFLPPNANSNTPGPGQLPPRQLLVPPPSTVYPPGAPPPPFLPSPTPPPPHVLYPRPPMPPFTSQSSAYPAINLYCGQNAPPSSLPQSVYPPPSGPLIPPAAMGGNLVQQIPQIPPQMEEIKPLYFDLPAGIMTQLIKLEDYDYNPIDPNDIRMPELKLSDRLMQAMEAFYAPPSHEHPRNAEGWERLGLYEFFRAKSQARSKYESENFKNNDDSLDSSNSDSKPLRANSSSKHSDDRGSPPKKQYKKFRERRSRSRSRSRERYQRRRRSRSSSRSESRSRSRSPPKSSSKLNRSKSYHDRKRSRSRSPVRKQYNSPKIESFANDYNKSYQPKSAPLFAVKQESYGNNSDNYPGFGVAPVGNSSTADPFECFRRNKGQAYIQRIKDARRE